MNVRREAKIPLGDEFFDLLRSYFEAYRPKKHGYLKASNKVINIVL